LKISTFTLLIFCLSSCNFQEATNKKLNNSSDSISFYSDRIKINDRNALDYLYRGNAYLSTHNSGLALRDYISAITIDSTNSTIMNDIGFAYQNMGSYIESIVWFNKALKVEENSVFLNNRAFSYYKIKNYYEAFRDLNRAIAINPKDDKAFNTLGVVKSKLGKYNDAIICFNKAIILNPKYAEAYINRASAYLYLNEIDKSVEDISKSLEIDSTHSRAYYIMAHVDLLNGDSSDATQDLRHIYKKGIPEADTLYLKLTLGHKLK